MATVPVIVEPNQPAASAPRQRARIWARRTVVWTGLAALLWHCLHVFAGSNIHTVIPGKVYRSAQPYGATLPAIVEAYGIRSIINLRGTCHPLDWYREEAKTAQQWDLALEDVNFSAGRRPSIHEIRKLVEALDRAEPPVLLHCRQGADRTGMAAVIAQLLYTDTPYATARRQLSLWYGHAPVGRATILDQFFDMYEAWLRDQQRSHEPAALRHWLLNEYQGGKCQGVIEEVAPLQKTARVGEPIGYRVRVRNTSSESWHFKPTRTAGVHLGFHLWNSQGKSAASGRAGFLDKSLAPGESLTITLVVPALTTPGRHRLFIDMVEECQCWFYQAGSVPYEEEIDVVD